MTKDEAAKLIDETFKLAEESFSAGYEQARKDFRTIEDPTVEAIPISYIQKQIERWERSKIESYHAICYRHLIEEWKMETRRKE